jgi:hypothetical protein
MELQELEELFFDLLKLVREILDSGEKLSDSTSGEVANFLQDLENKINTLKQQEPVEGLQPTQPEKPQLNQSGPSSNVDSFGYDDKTGKLMVRFLGDYPNREGPVYAYEGVPKEIYNLFQKGAVPARTNGQNKWGQWYKGKVPSLGASLYTLIKNGGYKYQKIS